MPKRFLIAFGLLILTAMGFIFLFKGTDTTIFGFPAWILPVVLLQWVFVLILYIFAQKSWKA